MKIPVSFIHTSPAAIGPIMQYYSGAAPGLEITNLLEDGILRLLSAGERQTAMERVGAMVAAARDVYHARAALVTCSSISRSMVEELAPSSSIPLIKIDDPMAEEAVGTGRRLGVAVTFAPTTTPTETLLRDAAARMGAEIETIPHVVEGAYDALLNGNPERHDQLLLAGIGELEKQNVDAIVLAQVSMARILPQVEGRVKVPVLSSLTSSLGALERALGDTRRLSNRP